MSQTETEQSASELEEEITHILTDPTLRAIKAMLEKDHAIDCLFLLLMDKGRWKHAKAYMQKHGLTLSDGTYRARMIEIEHLGLAKSTPIDPLKKTYSKTPKGEELARRLLRLLKDI